MAVLKTILTVAFILISLAITVVILKQEGKTAGLGSLSGTTTDSYWDKNKGRSAEGVLIKLTTIGVVLFLILAVVLNLGIWG